MLAVQPHLVVLEPVPQPWLGDAATLKEDPGNRAAKSPANMIYVHAPSMTN